MDEGEKNFKIKYIRGRSKIVQIKLNEPDKNSRVLRNEEIGNSGKSTYYVEK